jgi:hypothetical protein
LPAVPGTSPWEVEHVGLNKREPMKALPAEEVIASFQSSMLGHNWAALLSAQEMLIDTLLANEEALVDFRRL